MVVAIAAISAAAWLGRAQWWPYFAGEQVSDADEVTGHVHQHAGHAHSAGPENAIQISDKGLKNIGFRPITVGLQTYQRTESLPAIIVEQPGRTQTHVAAPLTGVIKAIYVVEGEAIEPGSRMFDMQLTHEELVAAQSDYLQTAERLDIVNREIARLKSLKGIVPGSRVLEQEYEKQKLEASQRADEQAMLLHGLNEEQIANILKTRQLLRGLAVLAPDSIRADDSCAGNHLYHVQRLSAALGQQVEAGQNLAILADHCELFVEGRAFEDDAPRLREAAQNDRKIAARLRTGDGESTAIPPLELLYLADSIDPDSRALRFFLRLPNEIGLDQKTPEGRRFIEWRFKPGQRLELRVPIDELPERIVLPTDAVVEEGGERYVYRQNGDRFERVPIHVEFSDRNLVVVANDGTLFPGDVVAGQGAYQMHLALKNKSGGGIDPHAGHSH
jgi:multidrug efflux pump subunit AcrA (membrane-fusion protein)